MKRTALGSAGSGTGDDEQWAPLSDLMTALMLTFMIIAILLMQDITREGIEDAADCARIQASLKREFAEDFEDWEVEILPDGLTIRFSHRELLFTFGTADLKPRFQGILRDFWPRYLDVTRKHERTETDIVKEIQIEGHTSTEWNGAWGDAYMGNMKLSVDRAMSTLQFVLDDPRASDLNDWAERLITANGLSFSKLVRDELSGNENTERSRRVEFRLITGACERAGAYDQTE